MRPGEPSNFEFEYRRHGTLNLIPVFDVKTGKIIASNVVPTRTETDFASVIELAIKTDPKAEWIFVCDQLNTHKSASLVTLVGKQLGLPDELGVKAKSGILKDMSSRQAFLEDPTHRIRFVYTPKHCSWLNQIECWFSILARKLLRHASFRSLSMLQDRLQRFIRQYNEQAKPFRWRYSGKLLSV